MFDPALRWRSIKTEHFWIHYHNGLEHVARRMSLIAEETHARLVPEIGWRPFLRTDVVLVDNMDVANGFASPFPYNRVQIFIDRAPVDSVLGNYDDWLRMVFTHEYTHTLNIDTINGIPAISRYTCGRACFPNFFQPIWALEGNPVYRESKGDRFGRNNSTYVDMMMRCEVMAGTFKGIDQGSHFPRIWPRGNVPYVYGGRFVEYLERRFGAGAFSRVQIANSDNLLPYFVNYNAKQVYGSSFVALWEDWRRHEHLKHRRHLDAIEAGGVTHARMLTESGYMTTLPRFSRDGSSVYYVRMDPYRRPSLMKRAMNGESVFEIGPVNDPNSLALSASGAAFISDVEYTRSFSLYNDAFQFRNGRTRLTRGLRARYIDVSADESRVVFVRNQADRYFLMAGDAGFKQIRALIADSDLQISFPRLSPDGRFAVFSLRDRDGSVDLAMIDIANRETTRLTRDASAEIHPCWHPDGEKIVFSSDRDGVFNLYELGLKARSISRVTNVAGGAFEPDVSPDGQSIAFASYDHRGFNIALIPYSIQNGHSIRVRTERLPDSFFNNREDIPGGQDVTGCDYSALRSVLPSVWIPVMESTQIYGNTYDYTLGLYTIGSDTLYRHQYYLMAAASRIQRRMDLQAVYAYSGLYPDLIVSYQDDTLFWGEDEFPWQDRHDSRLRRKMERTATAGLSVPFLYFRSSHKFFTSYSYDKAIWDWYDPGYEIARYERLLARIRGAYSYTSAQLYPFSISPEDGRSLVVIADWYDDSIASDLSFYKMRGEYAEYLPGFRNNCVFMVRMRGGASFNNPEYLSPYNLGRFHRGERGGAASGEDEFGMRGYPAGEVYGDRLAVAAAEYRFPLVQRDSDRKSVV
jgi:Tol biopolymer transport system component